MSKEETKKDIDDCIKNWADSVRVDADVRDRVAEKIIKWRNQVDSFRKELDKDFNFQVQSSTKDEIRKKIAWIEAICDDILSVL